MTFKHCTRAFIIRSYLRLAWLCMLFWAITGGSAFSQAPDILFQTVAYTYNINNPITTVLPLNNGGPVSSTPRSVLFSSGYSTTPAVAADADYLYVCDWANNLIQKVDKKTGTKSVLAGNGVQGANDGPANQASFNLPDGIVLGPSGVIYIADQWNHKIRKISGNMVTTIAGTGTTGNVNGPGNTASFNNPRGIAIGNDGNLYVADQANNAIRKITPAGLVSTFVGTGLNSPTGLCFDGDGIMYVADAGNNAIKKILPSGVVSTFATGFDFPREIKLDATGNFYVTDQYSRTLKKISPSGIVTIVDYNFSDPIGLAIDGIGTIYVADGTASRIMKVVLSGYTIDKTLPKGLSFDIHTGAISGVPTEASPETTYNITAINSTGSSTASIKITVNAASPPATPPTIFYTSPQIYTTNTPVTLTPQISGVVPSGAYGMVETFAGRTNGYVNGTGTAASFEGLSSIAKDVAGNFFVVDYTNKLIRKITPTGEVSTFAGQYMSTTNVDGPIATASFAGPTVAVFDSHGNIFVSDWDTHVIRKIDVNTQIVSTFAGDGTEGFRNGQGTSAKFFHPFGLVVDAADNLYVADSYNNLIRKITPSGNVTTFAGDGTDAHRDATGTAASIVFPMYMTMDAAGNIYVTGDTHNAIRKITPGRVVTTIAGNFDGVSRLMNVAPPRGIKLTSSGEIYFAGSNAIYKTTLTGPPVKLAGTGIQGVADGIGNRAEFYNPEDIIFGIDGNLYILDHLGFKIRKLNLTGFAIDKPLPPGLTFNYTNGVISGTPTASWPETTYTITAVNAAGSGSATLKITVNAIPVIPTVGTRPDITYPSPKTYTANQPINPNLVPTNTGGAVPATNYGQTTRLASNLNDVTGLTIGPDGFIYVCESGIHKITKIDPATFLPVASYGSGTDGADDGTTATAKFSKPYDVVIDIAGNIYVSDLGNSLIRKISAAGVVTTLVNVSAGLNKPKGLALDATGAYLYVADEGNNKIRKISTTTGQMTDVSAGTLSAPADVTFDKLGNLYIANTGLTSGMGSIIKIDANGFPSNYASGLNGPRAIQVDELGDNCYVNSNLRIDKNGNQVFFPGTTIATGLALDGKGLLYFTERGTVNIGDGSYRNGLLKTMVVTGYYRHTDLPAGLNFDGQTGIISGSPQATGSAFDYAITAYNVSGSSTFSINMRVNANALTPQAITFLPIPQKMRCNPPFAAGATSDNASLPIKYTSSNTAVADVDANTGLITLKGIVGTTTITASQPGNANYSDAAPKQQTLTVVAPVIPNVKINNNAAVTCTATPATFEAVVNNSASLVNPSYQWYINNLPVANNNTATYLMVVGPTDQVKCEVTNNDICPVTGEDMVTGLRQKDRELLTLRIETTAPTAVCQGTNITFTATPSINDSQNQYQWQLNGVNVGNNSTTFSSNMFRDGDVVSCSFTNPAAACVLSQGAAAINPTTVHITAADNPAPAVVITKSANNVYAETSVMFTATATNANGTVTYQWQVNGLNAGGNSATFTSSTLKNADKVTCTITTGNCNPPATSNEVFMTILPPITVTPATAFTPNGDGINDLWLISGLSTYPNCRVNIYNRAGESVFQSRGYSVPWDGLYNAKNLPIGTYYYVIELSSDKPRISGYVTLVR